MRYVLNQYHRNTSDDDLIADLVDVAKQLCADTVTIDEYNKLGKYHATTLTRRFGSWFKCLELSGLKLSRSMLNVPEEQLFQNLEELWKHFGRQPKYHEVRKPLSKFSVGTYEKRYGTFYNALNEFINAMNGDVTDERSLSENSTLNPRNINYRLRFKIMQRDNFKCRICGASPALNAGVTLHVDHIMPCAKGGQATMENLQTLCSKCNLGKSDLDM